MKYTFESKLSHPYSLESLATWAENFDHFAFYVTDLTSFSCGIGAFRQIVIREPKGAFAKLEAFQLASQTRIAGYLGYDLKNDLEALESKNPETTGMPEAVFFEPEICIYVDGDAIRFESNSETLIRLAQDAADTIREIPFPQSGAFCVRPTTTREDYIKAVHSLKKHIQRGDIYEANFCFQFQGQARDFSPLQKFLQLQELTKAPFSVFARLGVHHVLCASPERFLKQEGENLISQPIKGTIRRSEDAVLDAALKQQLRDDPKEQSENVMIVDLVRNDLSRIAARGTVKVDELFGIYSFKTVHHMISTVSAKRDQKYNSWDAIKACFPMGSMTGAPKISAMQIIERHENFKRTAYSGAFGWMDPNGDFDFNVMIRTLYYNAAAESVAFSVGSAITIGATAEKEYEECKLKARALMQALDIATTENEFTATIS